MYKLYRTPLLILCVVSLCILLLRWYSRETAARTLNATLNGANHELTSLAITGQGIDIALYNRDVLHYLSGKMHDAARTGDIIPGVYYYAKFSFDTIGSADAAITIAESGKTLSIIYPADDTIDRRVYVIRIDDTAPLTLIRLLQFLH